MARIGERIRALREKLGLSQGEIERATGLFRAYISRVEHGHTIPSLESIERFAAALGARSMNCSLNPRRQKALP
jgi:transcriptional regulator with XRE-family HTH domain